MLFAVLRSCVSPAQTLGFDTPYSKKLHTAAQGHFNQTPTEARGGEVPAPLRGQSEDTPVMMYCTGGIRCDIYSTYLRQKACLMFRTLWVALQCMLRFIGHGEEFLSWVMLRVQQVMLPTVLTVRGSLIKSLGDGAACLFPGLQEFVHPGRRRAHVPAVATRSGRSPGGGAGAGGAAVEWQPVCVRQPLGHSPPGERLTACATELCMCGPMPPTWLSMLAQTRSGWVA